MSKNKINKIRVYNALCSKCRKETVFMQIPPDDAPDSSKFWMVYSVCYMCNMVYIHGIHDKEPSVSDYRIDHGKTIKAGGKDFISSKKEK